MPVQRKTKASITNYEFFHRNLRDREISELGELDTGLKLHTRITRGGYIYKKVVSMLGRKLEQKSILDIGCGRGYTLRLLSGKWPKNRFVGVDFSKNAAYTSKIRNPSLDFVIADAQNLPFKRDSFDIVTMVETLEHIPETGKVFNEVSKVLRPHGLLQLSVPNSMCFFSRSTDLILYWINKKYLKRNETTVFPFSFSRYMQLSDQPIDGWFSCSEIKIILKNYGFKINKLDGWPLFPQIELLFPFYAFNIIIEMLPFHLRSNLFIPCLCIHSMWNCEKVEKSPDIVSQT